VDRDKLLATVSAAMEKRLTLQHDH
jgi:hypothetical protein